MSKVHDAIEEILKKYGDCQANLGSESARKEIANEICREVLSTAKMSLIREIVEAKNIIEHLKNNESWPHSDIY